MLPITVLKETIITKFRKKLSLCNVCVCVHACLHLCARLHLPVGLTVVMVDFSGVVGVVFCVVILVVGTVDGGA